MTAIFPKVLQILNESIPDLRLEDEVPSKNREVVIRVEVSEVHREALVL
ncbi:MAG: hypothetical protein ACREOO_02440 [bacterium]